MDYLLDTHIILWWLTEPEKIKIKARKIIQNKANNLFVSAVSLWEMAIKKNLGKLSLPTSLLETLNLGGFKILSITPDECLGVSELPLIHSDSFDRLLVIQAKLQDLIIITHDKKIKDYPVKVLEKLDKNQIMENLFI